MLKGKQIKKAIQFSEILNKLNNNLSVDIIYNYRAYKLCKFVLNHTCREYILMFTLNELDRNRGYNGLTGLKNNILYYVEFKDETIYIFYLNSDSYSIRKRLFKRAFQRANNFLLKNERYK